MVLDVIDGGHNEDRLIGDDLRFHVFGQGGLNLLQAFLDVGGRGDRVFAGLFGNDEGDGGGAIETRGGGRFFVAVFRVTDVANFHDVTAAVNDSDFVELSGIHDAACGAHREIAGAFFQGAAGEFEILRAQRVEDVGDGEVVGAQFVGIDQNVNFAFGAADDADLTDTFGVLELLLDQLVGDEREITERTRRGDGNLHDRRGIGIELQHDGLLGGLRQIVDDGVDFVLHLLRGDVAVLGKFERDGGEGLAFGRDRDDLIDLADGVDGVFHLLGDLGFNLLGRGAGVRDGDLDGGNVDLGEEIHAQAEVTERSDNDERQNQHRREDGALNAEKCECVHGGLLSSPLFD